MKKTIGGGYYLKNIYKITKYGVTMKIIYDSDIDIL